MKDNKTSDNKTAGFREKHRDARKQLSDNIAAMFFSTSITLIFTAITGVIAGVIDGVIASRFLGSDIFSGISLLRPFSSIVFLIAGFLANSCMITCSQEIGLGKKDESNAVFNLSAFCALAASIILLAACILMPSAVLRICGVNLNKYPELNPHMYDYLRGYMIGLPAIFIVQVIGPMIVMDNHKKLFACSSAALGIVDIVGDILTVTVFHAGALGMGLATSCGYIAQLLILIRYFTKDRRYLHMPRRMPDFTHMPKIIRNGAPTFIKRLASTFRDIVVNHLSLAIALTTAAIAAKGIQEDLFQILFCISSGLGSAMVSMTRIFHSANDMKGLKNLFTYALWLGFRISGIAGAAAFILAPYITRLYTDDPEVISFTVFSIRWMAVGLLFDTSIVILQNYLQGITNLKLSSVLTFAERMIVPIAIAYILGSMYGSKGVLASAAISKMVLLLMIFIGNIIRCKGLPKHLEDVMFLPEAFGGPESDNLYSVICNMEDVHRESERTYNFCMAHDADEKRANMMSLFVEELAGNIVEHAKKHSKDPLRADFRLYVDGDILCMTLRDIGELYDPTEFYKLHSDELNEDTLGIRIVMKLAKEVQYYSAFGSNNLVVYME